MIFVINMYIFRLKTMQKINIVKKKNLKMLTSQSLIKLVPFKRSSAIKE